MNSTTLWAGQGVKQTELPCFVSGTLKWHCLETLTSMMASVLCSYSFTVGLPGLKLLPSAQAKSRLDLSC